MSTVQEILTKILNTLTRAEKTQLDAPYKVNRYRHLYQNGKVTISNKPVFLDKIIVSKGGDQCVLTLFDGNNEIFKGILNDEFLRKGREVEPYNIKISTEIQNELRAELHSPRATSHFKLNAITGSAAEDSGSNDTAGVCKNMANDDWVSGKLYNCLDFDGVDDYVDCGNVNAAALNGTNPFSISIWVYKETTDTTGYSNMVTKYGSGKGLIWQFSSNSDVQWIRLIVSGTIIGIIQGTNLTKNVWHHLVFTYDGSQKVEGMKLYVDRTLQQVYIDNTGTFTGDMTNSADLNIASNEVGGENFDGKMDDFRFYDVELTSEQVSLIYNQGIGTEEEFNIADVIITYKENIIPTKALEVT